MNANAQNAPIANADNDATDENNAVTTDVLANDNDAGDGDTLTITSIVVSGPANGSASCISPNCTYTPSPNFDGADSYDYEVCDNEVPQQCATATVNISVNDIPVLTLSGADPLNLGTGDTYTDPGASATDAEDNNTVLTNQIVVGGDTVNTAVPATYIVTYDVTDSDLAPAVQITRDVIVTDDDAPVITLSGATIIDLIIGGSYSEPGFSATDNVDGDITGNVVVAGDSVNTNAVGTYVVTYNVSDVAGNPAAERTRTINVAAAPDITPPVITLSGATTIDLNIGDPYSEPGFSATDNVDGNITGNVVVAGDTVNTNAVGTYVVTYNVSDAAGNPATQRTRTISVVDNVPPVITLSGNTTINLNVGDSYSEPGFSATDNVDGNITGNVVVAGDTVNTNAVGTYVVTYNVSDAAGNPAIQRTRTVNVTDGNPPVITRIGPATVNLNVSDTYNEQGATATDPEEGSVAVVIGGDTVNTGVAGTYIVTYNASDSAGNNAAQVTRTVNVNDGNPPVITLIGPATVDLDAGDTYIEQGATATDPEEGTVTVVIGGDTVNTAVAGTYIVTYNASDSAGNNAAQVIRTVNVAAGNTAPIVTTPITDQTADEGAPYSLDVLPNFEDPDGDTLTFSATGLPASLDPIDPVDGIIFGNPTQAEAEANGGVYNVTVTATDPLNETASISFTLTISTVNDAPEVATPIGDRSTGEGVLYTLDVSSNFSDPDGDILTFTATGLPASLAPISAEGVIDGTPTQAEAEFNGGIYDITVTASDGNESVSDSFVLTIGVVNDPPVAVPQSIVTDEDIPIEVILSGTDPEDDVLTFAIAGQPLNGTVAGTGAIYTYTPNQDFSGTDSFSFTASDAEFTSAPAIISITINALNDPPMILLPIEDQIGVEGSPFALTITGNFTDPDGDVVSYIASGLPPSGNIRFDGQTGVFSGTPRQEDARDNDPYLVTVTAIDGGLDGSAVDDFALNISALNRANVSLDIIVSPDPAMQNDELRWTYTVRNTVGPQLAPNVVLNGSFFGTGLTVTTANACTIQAAVGQVTNFSCTVGQLPLGASTAIVLSTGTSAVGDVGTFATAEGADTLPIDPNTDDNSVQLAVGVAASFSNGAADILGTSSIRSAAFADVDGDGVGDLVLGTSAGQPIQVWLGDGFRGFTPAPLTVPDIAANEGIALADFTGNGRPDLVVANGGGQPDLVYRNDGSGNFTLMRTLGSTFSQDVAVGDFDGDGSMDIAFATIQGNPVYLGNGAGSFTLHATLGIVNSQAVAVARFNADTRDDLVFANVGSASVVWTKNAAAGFTSTSQLLIGDANAVTIGNFGGDASPDVAFGRTSSGIGDVPANPVLINDGTGQFVTPMATLGSATTTGIHAGDVDGDGLTDLVFINASGVHQIWVNTGSGFRLHPEQIFSDGAVAGVLAEIGMTDVGVPGGVDLAMGGPLQTGLGVFLNDSFGNLGMGDAVSPVLTLNGDATIVIPFGSVYTDAGATAEDNIDGTISASIVIGNPVNTSTLGAYTVTFNVMDRAGNAAVQISRTVNVAPATGGGGGGGGTLSPLIVFLLLMGVLFAAYRARRVIILVGGQQQK